MAEATGASAEVEELREVYLFVNDPFHSRFRGVAWVGLVAILATADALFSDPEDFEPGIPLGLLVFLGLSSSWARWNGRRFEEAALLRSLRRSLANMRWLVPFAWLVTLTLPACYGIVLWMRWADWTEVLQRDGSKAEDLGGWGSLLFRESDIAVQAIGLLPVWIAVQVTFGTLPLLRATLARWEHAYRVGTTRPPTGAGPS